LSARYKGIGGTRVGRALSENQPVRRRMRTPPKNASGQTRGFPQESDVGPELKGRVGKREGTGRNVGYNSGTTQGVAKKRLTWRAKGQKQAQRSASDAKNGWWRKMAT